MQDDFVMTKSEAFELFRQWGLAHTGIPAVDSRRYRDGCQRLKQDERIMTRQEYEQACAWLAEYLEI